MLRLITRARMRTAQRIARASAFGGIDGHDLMAIIFAGGPTPGPFSFRIDDIRFR